MWDGMKLLLDENLPHQLRHEIPSHDCFTVTYMGWSGVDNGELLALAESENFDALVTKDANLQYEQNLKDLPIAVVIVRARSNDTDSFLWSLRSKNVSVSLPTRIRIWQSMLGRLSRVLMVRGIFRPH